jgi:hypothetical protein
MDAANAPRTSNTFEFFIEFMKVKFWLAKLEFYLRQ